MNIFTILFYMPLVLCTAAGTASQATEEWRTLHGNLQRHGFYQQFPARNLHLQWRKELYQELTPPRAEVIVANGLAFMGTYEGNLYAWNTHTGEEKWVFKTNGPIGHSPYAHNNTLYIGSMDGNLYAIDIASGNQKWSFQAGGGIWTSPAVSHNLVLFGADDGIFYAVHEEDGTIAWEYPTQDRILNTASITPDHDKILFASEDMHLYCLSLPQGDLIWKTPKLHGLTFRDYYPTIINDHVYITTTPVKDFHTVMGENQQMFISWTDFEGEDDRYIFATDEKIQDEQQRIRKFLKANPDEQTFYAFNLEDGSIPWIAPLLYTGGLHNPMTPPAYNPLRDEIYVYTRSAYGVWDGGGEVRPYTGVGILDQETGFVTLIEHGHESSDPSRPAGRKDMPWMSFNTIGDETQTLATSCNFLLSIHQGYIGSLHLETLKTENLYGKRDTYGGFYGPGTFGWRNQGGLEKAKEAGEPYGIVNEWHGPARSIVSVVDNLVFYHVGSQILCLKGEKVECSID